MIINAVFDFAKVYDTSRFDVVKGQKLLLEADGPGKWFSDNDPILDLEPAGQNMKVVAAKVGTSVIWIFNDGGTKIKELTISVVDKLDPLATKLNLSAK